MVEVDTRKQIKCPKCGGCANQMFLVAVKGNNAIFIVECWSGDTHAESERHFFKQKVSLVK